MILIIAVATPVLAQPKPISHLIAIGDGYTETYAGFVKEAIANAQNGQVNILVLPITTATNATSITEDERAANTRSANELRAQIEAACQRATSDRVTCTAILAPIFTRADASDPSIIKYFLVDLSAIYILGGDQAVGTQVVTGTPLEEELTKAYQNGVIVAGTAAGGALLSATILNGYNAPFTAANALNFGAPDIWNTATKRGLSLGVKDALIDQHFYQRNRPGLLLNALARPDVPHVGIGIDAYTGLNIYDGTRLQDVVGLYTVTVFDAQTYHAADAVQYQGPTNTLSLRNVLVHLLAPGRVSYDLTTRAATLQSQVVTPRAKLDRTFNALTLPKGAGPLLLAGDLSGNLASSAVLKRFAKLADNPRRRVLIVATGYASDEAAQAVAEKYADALNMPNDIVVIPDRVTAQPLVVTKDVTGILLIADDQSKVKIQALSLIDAAWRGGLPLLADKGGAALVGRFFAAHAPTPNTANAAEIEVQKSFIQGTTTISNGLNLLNIMIEPQLLSDNRWGQLFSLTYNHPEVVALGIANDTALELSVDGAQVIGDNAIVALDLRTSQRALGTDDQFIIANGLLDVFAPGDTVKPVTADIRAQPVRIATPALPTLTPVPTLTPQPTLTPTSVPPTLTPTPTPTLTPTPVIESTPVPVDVASTPIFPIALVGGAIILLVVLLAARRPAAS
ncbi:MAG: cyanophycinase [Anaerolineae bacterium]